MLMQANYSSVKPLPSKKENFMKTAPLHYAGRSRHPESDIRQHKAKPGLCSNTLNADGIKGIAFQQFVDPGMKRGALSCH
jgi:hypothetical protein